MQRVHRVEWRDILLNDSFGSSAGRFKEFTLHFDLGLISVESAQEVFLGQISADLEFFVPISRSADIKPVEVH